MQDACVFTLYNYSMSKLAFKACSLCLREVHSNHDKLLVHKQNSFGWNLAAVGFRCVTRGVRVLNHKQTWEGSWATNTGKEMIPQTLNKLIWSSEDLKDI